MSSARSSSPRTPTEQTHYGLTVDNVAV